IENYATGFLNGRGSTFVVLNDREAERSMNVFTYLSGKVAGLYITSNGMTSTAIWRGGPPTFFLNESEIEMVDLQLIRMSDVAVIKVFDPPFLAAPQGKGIYGGIAIYTKTGKATLDEVRGLELATVMGYSPLREFYSPDYSSDSSTTVTDYRTTLYWNPFVLTDKQNRRVVLTFYNNDITSRIRVVMEGINSEGKLTRIERFLE
ncbi:MAG TPA: hypothetical protein VEB42_08225, partial [Chitinophagaceae bacterium]|nr:hypothetical protein [Chitinophagaceae bacterium]